MAPNATTETVLAANRIENCNRQRTTTTTTTPACRRERKPVSVRAPISRWLPSILATPSQWSSASTNSSCKQAAGRNNSSFGIQQATAMTTTAQATVSVATAVGATGSAAAAAANATVTSPMSVSRQHLSARVKTITGKLLESHGAELRRTLFSLRQIFQDDSELATEFLESDGLECLMKVALDADQIHQNYILRALGQLIVYPSGMNELTRHNETIRWLYTLIGSQTSIKLLLLFVDHSDNNCLHFCRSIKAVEGSKGALLWTTIIDLFKSSKQEAQIAIQQQDVSLLVDAMTLINKTLAGIPDQDTYYDFVEPLEQLGIESIMKRYSSLDAQLKQQFDIYEQTLRAEEDDDDDDEEDNDENDDKQGDISSVTNTSGSTATATVAAKTNATSATAGSQVGANASKTVASMSSNSNSASGSSSSSSGSNNNRGDKAHQVGEFLPHNNNNNSNLNSPKRRLFQPSSRRIIVTCGRQPETDSGSHLSSRQIVQPKAQLLVRRQQLEKSDEGDESAEMAADDNYESADELAHEDHSSSNIMNSTANGLGRRTRTNKPTTPTKLDEQTKGYLQGQLARHGDSNNGNAQQKQQQQPQNNLARGKHQRASISSCSSSDSYASYGSGYASGSGNSTDHELKQKSSSSIAANEGVNGNGGGNIKNDNSGNGQLSAAPAAGGARQHKANRTVEADEIDDTGAEEGDDDDSKLKQHLSELEQLTDELANRNIFGARPSQAGQSTSSKQPQPQQQQQQQQLRTKNTDSRSTSTTPTTANQAQPHSNSNNNGTSPSSVSVSSAGFGQASHVPQKQEPYYYSLFQWEQLVSKGVTRPLLINDLDFTDLSAEDDYDLLNANSCARTTRNQATNEPLTINIPSAQRNILGLDQDDHLNDSGTGTGSPVSAPPPMPPPPISPWFSTISGSRPQSQLISSPSPPYEQQSSGEFNRDHSPSNSTYSNFSRNSVCVPQMSTPYRDNLAQHHQYNTLEPITTLRSASSMSSLLFENNRMYANGRKKTMKLFWKEMREDRSLLSKLTRKRTIWDELKPVQIDTQKLEHLFESKAKDFMLSKSRNGDVNQRKVKITVLDAKRSNAINIGMTKLPPMRTIKTAILKMDSSIMNREGIEKILTTMMPSEEEKSRIIEAQLANPDTPLGTAEQFLLNLASISALEARLKLWAFQLDYAQIENEVAEPLMDLKQAIEEIESSETFRIILSTLLAIGNFLNSTNAKGFQIDYLEKVPEVKDTVQKHSLLHHLCLFIQEKYGSDSTTDLYSEFSAVNRASKVDYSEVAKNLKKMQQDCKSSWDYLKIVAKHDGLANMMNASGSSSLSSAPQEPSNSSSTSSSSSLLTGQQQPKSSGKLNNLSKLSMITTVTSMETSEQASTTKQLKTKVSDFLTDCAERIMVLMVIHRRVMNRFQKLLVYLGCPSHQIKQTQPQQILKIINEFALEYRTKRERVREMLVKKQECQHQTTSRWQLNRTRWAGSQQCIKSLEQQKDDQLRKVLGAGDHWWSSVTRAPMNRKFILASCARQDDRTS